MKNLIPRFIHDHYKRQEFAGAFDAFGLFIDISGFTAMTESLMKHGREGAEVLAGTLMAVFDPLIMAVYAQKGMVTGFAGDAFTAIFQVNNAGDAEAVCRHALAAARNIQQIFETHAEQETKFGNYAFAVKVGVGWGHVEWGILESERLNQHTYFFKGTAIDDCAQAESHAEKGQLIVSKAIVETAGDLLKSEAAGDGFVRVTKITGELPEPQHVEPWKLNPEDQIAFLPPEIVHMQALGEFRRVVTVFLGVDGMKTREDLQEFIKPVFNLLQRYRGTLTRLDFGDKGCNLLMFWGVPVQFENDAERALNFLLDLKKEVSVPFRAGVTQRLMYAGYAGGSMQGEFTAYGRGINMAARMMTRAEWGEVWIDDQVSQLITIQSRFEIPLQGNYDFKGFAEPVPVRRLEGQKTDGRSIFYQGEMVGRETEFNQLQEFIQPIFEPLVEREDGEADVEESPIIDGPKVKRFAGVFTVYGEAGMGKSRLVYELRTGVLQQRFVWWFYCPCNEILRHSLNPFKYFMRNFFEQSPSYSEAKNKANFESNYKNLLEQVRTCPRTDIDNAPIVEELERTRTILMGMLDLREPGSLWEQLEPKLRFQNELYAFKNLILACSLIRPVILSIDDLQWMDADSQELLSVFTRNVDAYPIALLCTSRYFDDQSKPTLKIDSEINAQQIDLNTLQPEGIQAIAEQITEKSVTENVTQFLQEKTHGNPFFVEQLTLMLKERELLTQADKQYELVESDIHDIPPTVTDVLISRLDRLPMEVRQVVQTAAVLGEEFDIPVLRAILQNDPNLDDEVKAAIEAAIWNARTEINYIFRHALMRDAAYEMQLKSRLRETHRRAAEAFENIHSNDLEPHYSNLAHHYEKAEDVHKTMEYLEKAGLRAKELYQNEQALIFLDKLIDMLRAKAGLSREELGLTED